MTNTRNSVLIVDDDPAIRKVLLDYLKKANLEVLTAEDSEAALKVISRQLPDIILLDIILPGTDGFELCRRLKKDTATKDIPILFLTGKSETGDKVLGFKVGAVDYITKPIQGEEVAARVKTHLTIRNLQKKLEEQNAQLQQEIDERKRAEEQIKDALQEKEVLLKEIHHRVENNLQTISSILNLQSMYIKDKQALKVVKNSMERIRAMALVHEKLYQSRDLSKIDFREYIHSLVKSLFDSYCLNSEQVQLKIEIEDIVLDIERAIPLGLTINELVTNSLKHAFPNNRKGGLRVDLGKSKDKEYDYTLIIGDNGIGYPSDFKFRDSDSLGKVLVRLLVKQLHGVIDLDRNNGTIFTIKFKKGVAPPT
jgi:two-component sensor histidine kinase